MTTNILLNPPASNAYLSEIVPLYTNNGTTLDLMLLWNVGNGSANAPLQVLQYNSTTNSFDDVTNSIFSGSVPTLANPRNVTVADFNSDGNPDFIIANQGLDAPPWPGTTDTLLLSTSSGKLINASANLPQTLSYTHDVSSGVIDQSGDIGVFFNNVYSQPNTAPYYLISKGNGTFTNDSASFLPQSLHSTYPTYTASALVDLNGDGRADLIVGAEDLTKGPSLVYLNPGNGDFSHVTPIALPASPLPATQSLYSSALSGPTILDIEPIHISSSKYNDLVVISTNGTYTAYAVQILINDGTGHFTDQTATRLLGAPSSVTYTTTGTEPWVVRSFIADLNGHGPDIITQGINGAPSQVFLNNGSGQFNLAMSLPSSTPTSPNNMSIDGVATVGGVPQLIEVGGGQLDLVAPPQTASTFVGGPENDVFRYFSGNYTISGGGGIDTAVYTENSSAFQINGTVDSLTVVSTSGLEGTGTLHQVDRLQFADKILAFDISGHAGETYRLFQAAFDRTPDLNGVSYWTKQLDSGLTLHNLAQAFVNSAEFASIYGTNPTSQNLITHFFTNVLGRAPETAGLNYWVNELQSGVSKADVLVDFSESPENQAHVNPTIAHGISLSNAFFV